MMYYLCNKSMLKILLSKLIQGGTLHRNKGTYFIGISRFTS